MYRVDMQMFLAYLLKLKFDPNFSLWEPWYEAKNNEIMIGCHVIIMLP